MSITVEEKARLITDYATKAGDTGSPEVQVAILSSRIATLTACPAWSGAASASTDALSRASPARTAFSFYFFAFLAFICTGASRATPTRSQP
jgi:hypothetical protein